MPYVQKNTAYNPIFIAPDISNIDAVFLWGIQIDDVINTPYTLITPTQCTNLTDTIFIKPKTTNDYNTQTHIMFYTIKTDPETELETIIPYYGYTVYNYLFNATKKVFPLYFANSVDVTSAYAQLIRVNDGYYWNWETSEFQASVSELELTHIDNPLELDEDVTNIFYGSQSFEIPDAQNTYILVYRYVYESTDYYTDGEYFSFTSDEEYSGGTGEPDNNDSGGSGETNIEDGTPATKVHIGLYYRFDLETLKVESGSVQGTSQGKFKRLTKANVRFYKSSGIYKIGDLTEQYSEDLGNALYTGDLATLMPPNWDKDGHIKIISDQPVPLEILAITPTVTTEEI